MKLVNVRLSDEDAAKVAELRREGIELATLVREAVRARYLAMRPALEGSSVRGVLAAIYAAHPLPEEAERLAVNASDRRAVRRHVRRRLIRSRR